MARIDYIVMEIDTINDKIVGFHQFTLPDVGEDDFYRSRTSCNAFCHGLKKRNRSKFHWFHGQRLEDFLIVHQKPMKDVIKNHNTIWDFYKEIGYDHKKNKYLEDKNGRRK